MRDRNVRPYRIGTRPECGMRKSLELLEAQSKTPAFVPQYKNLLRSKESRIHPARKIPTRIRSRRNPTAAIRIRHYRVLESEWRCPGNLKRRKFPHERPDPSSEDCGLSGGRRIGDHFRSQDTRC